MAAQVYTVGFMLESDITCLTINVILMPFNVQIRI